MRRQLRERKGAQQLTFMYGCAAIRRHVRLLEEFHHDNHCAEDGEHNSQGTVQSLCRSFVGKDGSDSGEEQGACHAQKQYSDIRHSAQIKMTGSAGKCGKGHDEYTGANGGFQLVAKNGGEDQKHHHAAAGSHKAADQADDDSAENGLDDPGLFVNGHHSFLGGHDRFYNKFDSKKHGHNSGKAAHGISRNKFGKKAGNEGKNHNRKHHHKPVFNIQVFVFSIFISGDSTGQHITGESDSDGLVRFHAKEGDEHGADDSGGTHSGKTGAKTGTEAGKNADKNGSKHKDAPFWLKIR